MIPYGKQSIDQDDIQAVADVLKTDWLTQGPKVKEFEERLADFCQSRFAVTFSSGTTALQAAYFSAGLGPDDEIITTPLTFTATSSAALWLGAKPVFSDVDIQTGNLDPVRAREKVTPKTKVLAPVDYAGHPADWDALHALAKDHNLTVVQDACHALGASYGNKPIGGLSDLTVFSFHPVKSITTGEGGAVLTNREDIYKKLVRFRHCGITKSELSHPSPGEWYHEQQDLGLNGRLTDFQSALGLSQLKKLGGFVEKRSRLASLYKEKLKNIPHVRMIEPRPEDRSAWHLLAVVLEGPLRDKRDEVFKFLREKGVGVQVHYIPVYKHPFYRKLGYTGSLCPVAESLSKQILSLPIFPGLEENLVGKIVDILSDAVESYAHSGIR